MAKGGSILKQHFVRCSYEGTDRNCVIYTKQLLQVFRDNFILANVRTYTYTYILLCRYKIIQFVRSTLKDHK